jgi:uncharacterized protein (TIGR03118 family)
MGPIWISNQVSDNATVFDGKGVRQPLTVSIPFNAAVSDHGPTGVAFNPGQSFNLSTDGKSGPATFIFGNLDGSIDAWNNSGDNTKATKVFTSPTPAGYTGVALHTGGGGGVAGDRIYAVDGLGLKVDVLDSSFNKITTSGDFKDPSVPSGLFPFNIANINDKLIVTFTEPGDGNDDAPQGRGAIAMFDLDGHLIKHLADGGRLATPWGVTLAPHNFGDFSDKLLIGNFSNEFGEVNAFDPDSGQFLGTLRDKNGNPIRNPYLWAVIVGNGTNNTSEDQLYLTAGPEGETRGVFATIAVEKGGGNAIPLPPAIVAAPLAGVFAVTSARRVRRKVMTH